jgi:ArsR family transcriptional regulator
MRNLISLVKVLANPARLRVVLALRQNELCVCELSDALEIGQSPLSTHLQYLRQSDLVQTRRDSKWIYYHLNPKLAPFMDALLTQFKDELQSDEQLQHDTERIHRRLQLREKGRCVLGFNRTRGGKATQNVAAESGKQVR